MSQGTQMGKEASETEEKGKGARFILDALHEEGLKHVFMVPGGLLEPFLQQFGEENSGIEPIVAAHEGGAAYMADGYARASGGFGVCLAIGGPGVANTIPALAAAYADQSPVLLISGQVQTDWEGRGAFQDASPAGLNDIELLRPLVKYVEEVRLADDIPHHLHVALRSALGYVPGPVCVSVPKQIQDQEEEIKTQYKKLTKSAKKAQRFVVEGGVDWAVDKILESGPRIAILAGYGATRSGGAGTERKFKKNGEDEESRLVFEDLVAFAEAYHIPVATTLRAKGVFPEDHELSLGVFGYAGTRHATECLMGEHKKLLDNVEGLQANTDVLIVLGSSLNQRDTMVWSPHLLPKDYLIQVDINPSSFGRNFPPASYDRDRHIQITGDVRTALRSFRNHRERETAEQREKNEKAAKDLDPYLKDTRQDRKDWLDSIKKSPRRYDDENTRESNDVPLHPARVITDLRKVAPNNTVILIDSGAHRAFAGHYWDSYSPRHYLSSTTLAPMGWAIPAAIGAKRARPDLPCVVVTGDGCMLMHGMEIQTAAHNNLKVIFAVFNNGALGNVRLRQKPEGSPGWNIATLTTHDWVKFAESLGAEGERVETPDQLEPAFERAFDAEGTFVLDIRVDPTAETPITPWSEAKDEEKEGKGKMKASVYPGHDFA